MIGLTKSPKHQYIQFTVYIKQGKAEGAGRRKLLILLKKWPKQWIEGNRLIFWLLIVTALMSVLVSMWWIVVVVGEVSGKNETTPELYVWFKFCGSNHFQISLSFWNFPKKKAQPEVYKLWFLNNLIWVETYTQASYLNTTNRTHCLYGLNQQIP